MIKYAKPRVSARAQELASNLIKHGKFAPAEAVERIENLFDGYFGVFTNSGTSANYLMVRCAMADIGVIGVPPIGFATTYAPLIANIGGGFPKTLVLSAMNPDTLSVVKYNGRKERILHSLDAPLLGIPSYKTAEFADYCDCLEPYGEPEAFTLSFHPAHQINGGGGGAVYFRNADYARKARSIAYWGRTCTKAVCTMNCEGCNGRKRYEYAEHGQNIHGSEINAVIMLDNWEMRDKIREARVRNYKVIAHEAVKRLHCPPCAPSPFAVPIRAEEPEKFKAHMRERGIEYRELLTSVREYVKQINLWAPCYDHMNKVDLRHRDWVFVGCHDQYTREEVQTIADAIGEYERQGGE